MNFDAIIIGGGLGGLTAGAKLSKQGKRVLLLEQHYIPGGCATAFKRKDYVVEVGLHELDGLHETDLKSDVFKFLDVFENIEFVKIPEFFKLSGNINFTFPHGNKKAYEALAQRYPDDAKAIRKLLDLMSGVLREIPKMPEGIQAKLIYPLMPLLFPNLTKASNISIGDWLDKNIKSEELKLVILGNLVYYHDDPYTMSLIYFSAAQASYIDGGGYFIKGGSQKLSNHLAKVITDNNGSVRLGKRVKNIIIENGKAVGVRYFDAFNKSSKPVEVFAEAIIANAAVPIVKNMLPEPEKSKLGAKIDNLKESNSLFTIYIGFTKKLSDLGVNNYSTIIMDNSIKTIKDVARSNKGSHNSKGFLFVDYSNIDSGLAPDGKSLAVICSADYMSNWKHLSDKEYKKEKERVGQAYLDRLEIEFPGICEHIDFWEVSTAKTIQRYTSNPKGAPYGYAQTVDQAVPNRISHVSMIPNLYFASAWTMPGGGFTGAIISGSMCADKVMKKIKNSTQNVDEYSDSRIVKLIKSKEIATDTIELTFEKPDDFDFIPGQYAILELEDSSSNLDIPHRPLSIASHPDDNFLKFAMRNSESNYKKSCYSMKPGALATIYGPMGNFVIENYEKDIVFIIAGIGITPIIPFIKALENRNHEGKVHLFYSNRTEDKATYHDFLNKVNLPGFVYTPIFTKTDGRINIEILNKMDSLQNKDYYMIGTSPFLKGMKSILIENGVDERHIRVDDFG